MTASSYAETSPLLSLGIVVGLALVHLLTGRVRLLKHDMNSPWLSASAGVAIGYVFIHLLPKLADMKYGLAGDGRAGFVERQFFFFVMLGFLLFYKMGWASGAAHLPEHWRNIARWAHRSGFIGYSLMLGYTVTAFKNPDIMAALLVTAILGFHLMGVDLHLRHARPETFDRQLRYLLAASVVVGWVLGITTDLSDSAVAVWTALLAGGMLMMVFREELPGDLSRHYLPFTTAVIVSSLAIEFVKT